MMDSTQPTSLGLFQAFGIELEYMILDRDSLLTKPIAESILLDEFGKTTNDISLGAIDLSNELATHVLEFKSPGPTANLGQLSRDFADAVSEFNRRLAERDAVLCPGGIHPFMNPTTDSGLWSKGDRSIYDAYDRIFDCRRHGWLNLQSCHLNLPFANEEEFARLHAAIILILPFLSALAASSPYIDGEYVGYFDTRLKIYAENQAAFPQIAGKIVPEPVFTFAEYDSQILQPAYRAIAPSDPDSLLQCEWLNSRGAIARFDRNAIEIRVLDTQENPGQDIAICSLIITVLETLCELPADTLVAAADNLTTDQRREQFMNVARDGMEAAVSLPDLAKLLNLSPDPSTVGKLWQSVVGKVDKKERVRAVLPQLKVILQQGSLASRMLRRYGEKPSREDLINCERSLAKCLGNGTSFEAKASE